LGEALTNPVPVPGRNAYGLGARKAAILGGEAAFEPPPSDLLVTAKHSYMETLLINNA